MDDETMLLWANVFIYFNNLSKYVLSRNLILLDYIEEINLKNSICWYAFYASGWQLKHSYLLHPSFSRDDVINLNPFPRYWPFVWGINRSPVNFPPHKGTATQNFDVFFDLRLNKLLSKQSGCRWFEMPALSILRHCNKHIKYVLYHLFMMHHKEVEIKPIWIFRNSAFHSDTCLLCTE